MDAVPRRRFRPVRFTPDRTSDPRQSSPITEGAPSTATHLREGRYRRALALADLLAAAVAAAVLITSAGDVSLAFAAAVAPLIVVVNKLAGLYERDDLVLNKTTLDEFPSVVQATGLFLFITWLVLDGVTSVELDATAVTLGWAGTALLVATGRTVARSAVGRVVAPERCLVVGDEQTIAAVKDKVGRSRVKVELVPALDITNVPGEALETVFLDAVLRYRVDRVIIAPPASGATETLDLIRAAKHAGVRISVVPRMMEVVGSSVEFDHLDGMTMFGVRRFGLTRSSHLVKRSFDVAGSTVMLIAAAPLMLLFALAIKLDSRGPVFFCQTRVGKGGRTFSMCKFRSMVDGAEIQKDALRHLNATQGLFKIADDPRVTRVGRFLRRTSLDELPQLFNVWRGEMSLVGPRPLVLDEDAQVRGYHRHRLHLTPGMTGHWQILGSTRVPLHEMVGIDYVYVANWTLWTDIKILLRTVPHIVGSRGL